jgi:hypothetical protein
MSPFADYISDSESTLHRISLEALEDEENRKKLFRVLRQEVAILVLLLEVFCDKWMHLLTRSFHIAIRKCFLESRCGHELHQASCLKCCSDNCSLNFEDSQMRQAPHQYACCPISRWRIAFDDHIGSPYAMSIIGYEHRLGGWMWDPHLDICGQIFTIPSVSGGLNFLFNEAATSVVHMPR